MPAGHSGQCRPKVFGRSVSQRCRNRFEYLSHSFLFFFLFFVLSAGIPAVLISLLDPFKTCLVPVYILLCLSRLHKMGCWIFCSTEVCFGLFHVLSGLDWWESSMNHMVTMCVYLNVSKYDSFPHSALCPGLADFSDIIMRASPFLMIVSTTL